MTTTFGYFNNELEVNIKFRQLSVEHCQDFVSKYEELPKNEYIFNVLNLAIANIDSEVRPALARLDPVQADHTLLGIYNGCVMLNPVLDIYSWGELMVSYNPFVHKIPQDNGWQPPQMPTPENFDLMDFDFDDVPTGPNYANKPKPQANARQKPFSLTKAKLNAMPKYLKARVIGQNEPLDAIHAALLRYQVGLNDPDRPIGVFFFCGPSGVGKTLVAKELQGYLFDSNIPMLRLDCGEFQHKHENQKLTGSPAGYTGYEDGGFLAKMMANANGTTVVLLDEAEKAHKDFWDIWLKAFDDGYITDAKGNRIDFRNTIIIMTSNLGNDVISQTEFGRKTGFTAPGLSDDYDSTTPPRRTLVVRETMEAIRKHFRPEFLNRLDDIIIFNHLSRDDFRLVADLQFKAIAKKLAVRHLNLEWTPEASDLLVLQSAKAMEGARSMARVRRTSVEDKLAVLLHKSTPSKGKTFKVCVQDGDFVVS